MKNKLVIIGANDFQTQLIKKAKQLNYETHVFAWEDGAVGKNATDFFYPISVLNKDEILTYCKKIQPAGICSIGSELTNITANYLADKLNLTCNSAECTLLSTNKYEMRKAFEKNKIPSPKSILVDAETYLDNIDIDFPVLVKPTDRSGSRGITKIFKQQQLKQAVIFACTKSFEKKALIEEFVEGKEYSVEFISYKGTHSFLALTEKFTTGAPHYVEFAHRQPAIIDNAVLENIKKTVAKALDALQIKYGASHSEIKGDEYGNIKLIEVASRMGGDCIGSDLVPLSTGFDYMKMVIDIATGKNPNFSKQKHCNNAFIRFICTEKDLIDVHTIKNQYKENLIRETILNSKINSTLLDSNDRYGYIIFGYDDVFPVDTMIYTN